MSLSNKHRRTLRLIFEDPIRSNVKWVDIENLLGALGAEMSQGRGSRLRVYLNGIRAVFYRPHPEPDTDKGALGSVRRFLAAAGIRPEV